MQTPDRQPGDPTWLLAAGLLLAVVGLVFEPGLAQDEPGEDESRPQTRVIPALSGAGTADSNGSMIAVTGVDVTGQSILYLVDTEGKQLCVYQASGGGSSTQGVRFVGARRIELDLLLDGYNDKTEYNGKSLGFKDLQRWFDTAPGSRDEDR